MPDDVREEAERLAAAALAAASFALRNAGRGASLSGLAGRFLGGDPFGPHLATGTPECCVCPVCRGIAALRDPSPEFVARVATGASDLASGLTTILRAFSDRSGSRAAADATEPGRSTAAGAEPPPGPRPPSDGGPTWHAATRDDDWPEPAADGDAEAADPWHAATTAPPPPRKMAKKAVRKPPPPEHEAQA